MAKTAGGTDPKPIGIDLGTTNSAMAWVDASGRTVLVPNAEGELLTPSVVLFEDAEVVVGKDARSAVTVSPDRVAVWVKRDMGAAVYSRPIRGTYIPPEVIQACILRKLKTDLLQALGPESRVVITVPAYFDELRRKATADAGEMAGFNVLDIVNEPTAAALAFGEVLGYLDPNTTVQGSMNVLVYDLGGGTFDVTVLRLSPGHVQTLATDGDVQLGGYDWDLRLVNHVAQAFQAAYGSDPREDHAAVNRLFNAAVDAKHTLSARSSAHLSVTHAQQTLQMQVTREQFEEMTADLLDRTAHTTRQLLAAARLDWSQISRVLLVGGSTRMPMVRRMLRTISGIAPDQRVNPDEAVARGAALYARYLLGKQSEVEQSFLEVVNVNSRSLGVEGIHPETLCKINVILIPHNTALPVRVKRTFSTRSEGQSSIVIQVLEGESSLPEECTALGRAVIRELPPGLPAGWPVEVTFQYASNGRLTVHGVVAGTERETCLAIERDVGLNGDGIARWRDLFGTPAGFSAVELMVEQVASRSGSSGPLQHPSQPVNDHTGPESALPEATDESSPVASPGSPAPEMSVLPPSSPATPVALPASPWSATPPVADPNGTMAWTPATADPQRLSESGTRWPSASERTLRAARSARKRFWINVIGYLLSAIVGLAVGYAFLSWKNPEAFPWPF